ncbi:NosD domain-containing protein [Methanohalophilus sp.]
MLIGTTGASNVVVDDNGNGDYVSIQAAVDGAASGDIIIVNDGQYTENVVVDKKISIISNSLSPENTIIQSKDSESSIFSVQANNVTIDGFKIIGLNASGSGISINNSTGCSITNNILSGNFWGIHLLDSSKNTIGRNIFRDNKKSGIFLVDSYNNLVINNSVNNQLNGVVLSSSKKNILKNNSISGNVESGILLLEGSEDNQLYGNQMTKNKFNFGDVGGFNDVDQSNLVDGKKILYFNDVSNLTINASSNAGTLYFYDCKNIILKDLVVANNLRGVNLYNTDGVSLYNVSSSNNEYGLYLKRTMNGIISDCSIHKNSLAGVYLGDSKNCLIEKNHILNNDYGIYFDASESNEASENLIANNSRGILEALSSSNAIIDNKLSNNYIGIFLYRSSKNKIDNNEFLMNRNTGISLQYSDENILTNNKVNKSNRGVVLEESSSNNSVYGNRFFDNRRCIIEAVDENNVSNNSCKNNIGGIQLIPFINPIYVIIIIVITFVTIRRTGRK